MPEHDGLMRIFWPTDIPRSDLPGVVVGWRNSKLDVFVVAILEAVDVSLRTMVYLHFILLLRIGRLEMSKKRSSCIPFSEARHIP